MFGLKISQVKKLVKNSRQALISSTLFETFVKNVYGTLMKLLLCFLQFFRDEEIRFFWIFFKFGR